MIDANKIIEVANRSAGVAGYTLQERGIHRNFQPRETKKIPFEELQALVFAPGGQAVLKEYLIVKDKEALEELLPEVEPEYFYDEKKIREILTTGSTDLFLDTLDFAPQGVVDLIKEIAVNLPLNDMSKANAIKNKTGFDVIAAIEQRKSLETEEEKEKKPTRRVSEDGDQSSSKPVRRVVKKEE